MSLAINNETLNLDYLKKGIYLARYFYSATTILDYSLQIAGDRYVFNAEKTLHFFLKNLIDSLSIFLDKADGISTNELISLFSSFPLEANQFLCDQFASKQLRSITAEIEESEKARVNSPKTASATGKSLVRKTKSDILYLKSILGIDNFQYQIIADKLAVEVIQCGIDFFNSTNNDIEYQSEYEFALDIAVKQNIIDRAKENLDSCIALKQKYINDDLVKKLLLASPINLLKSSSSPKTSIINDSTLATICWFCGVNPSEEVSKYNFTIYHVNSRSYRKVNYSYAPYSIQRCPTCKEIHDNRTNKMILSVLGLAVIGLLIGALAEYLVFGLIVGIFLGFGLGVILSSEKNDKYNIKSTSDSTIKNHPGVKNMRAQGWQLSVPTAK